MPPYQNIRGISPPFTITDEMGVKIGYGANREEEAFHEYKNGSFSAKYSIAPVWYVEVEEQAWPSILFHMNRVDKPAWLMPTRLHSSTVISNEDIDAFVNYATDAQICYELYRGFNVYYKSRFGKDGIRIYDISKVEISEISIKWMAQSIGKSDAGLGD